MMIHRSHAFFAVLLAVPLGLAAADPMGLPPLPGGDPLGLAPAPAASSSQADIAKLQAKVDELLQQAKGVREGEDRLTGAIDRLLNATGVRFGGEAVTHSISYTLFPTAANSTMPNVRAWPSVGYFDFEISAHPRPELSATVIYRMEKVFGGFWGSLDISGVRRFNIHGETSIGFDAGDFNYKHTPLTVWAPQDEFPFETEVLARKRREGMAAVYLPGDNTWPLQGIRVDGTVELFGALDMALEGIGVRTAIAGTKNTGLGFAVLFPYDQYLLGATAAFSPKDSRSVKLGVSYFELLESVDTSILPPALLAVSRQMRSNVAGADLELQLLGESVVLKGEGAISNYTYDYGHPVTWTTGGAGDVQIVSKGANHHVVLYGLYTDERFINYAAQTRTQFDPAQGQWGQIPTGNNLLDPHVGGYGLLSAPNQFFTQFNPIIFATSQGAYLPLPSAKNQQQLGGFYLQPGERNRALPYGWATPNRAGYGVDAEYSFLDGALKPRLLYGSYSEPYQAYYLPQYGPRYYTRYGVGGKLDLTPLTGLPLILSGGWMDEATGISTVNPYFATSGNTYVVQTGDFGLDWQALKGVHLLLGWEQNSAYGTDYFPSLGPPMAVTDNLVWTTETGGIDWAISKSTDFYITYAHHDVWYPSNTWATYGAEEFEGKLSMRF